MVRQAASLWPARCRLLHIVSVGLSELVSGLVLLSTQTKPGLNSLQRWAAPDDAVDKAVQLVRTLISQQQEDQQADLAEKTDTEKSCQDESTKIELSSNDTTRDIQTSNADLRELQAKSGSLQIELDDAIGAHALVEKQAQDANLVRAKQKSNYELKEKELLRAIGMLNRALAILGGKSDAFLDESVHSRKRADGPSLLKIAKKLRNTMEHSQGLELSELQRETLTEFVRLAAQQSGEPNVPSFLQVGTDADADSDAGDVSSTIASIRDQLQNDLGSIRKVEEGVRKLHGNLSSSYADSIEHSKSSIETKRKELFQIQQQLAELNLKIQEGERSLEQNTDVLNKLQAKCMTERQDREERMKKRQEGLEALNQGLEILNSVNLLAKAKSKAEDEPPNFAQLLRVQSTKSSLEGETNEGAPEFVQLRSARFAARSQKSGDPFSEVARLISTSLAKLESERDKNQQTDVWCKKEMEQSTGNRDKLERTFQKIADQIDQCEANMQNFDSEIATAKRFSDERKKAIAEMRASSAARHENTTKAIAQCREAQSLLNSAIAALEGAGPVIIGLLEIAAAGFGDQCDTLARDLKTEQQNNKEYLSSAEVSEAVLQKQLEANTRSRVKQESDCMRMKDDLETIKKELDAASSYLDRLMGTCVVKADSYDERKQRMENLIESLKEALQSLGVEYGSDA